MIDFEQTPQKKILIEKTFWIYGLMEILWEKKYFKTNDSLDECRSMALEEYLFGLGCSTEEEITDYFLEFMLNTKE